MLLLACAHALWALTLVSAADIVNNRGDLGERDYFKSHVFQSEMQDLLTMIIYRHNGGPPPGAERYWDIRQPNTIQYAIKDERSGKSYTNMDPIPDNWPKTGAKVLQQVEIVPRDMVDSDASALHYVVNDWNGTVLFLSTTPSNNVIQAQSQHFATEHELVKQRLQRQMMGLAAYLVAASLLTYYLARHRFGHLSLSGPRGWYARKFPLDVRAGAVIVVGIAWLISVQMIDRIYVPFAVFEDSLAILMMTLMNGFLFYNALGALTLINNGEELSRQWRDSVTMQLKECLERRGLLFKFLIFVGIAVVLGCIPLTALAAEGDDEGFVGGVVFLYYLFLFLIVIPYLVRKLVYLNKIVRGVSAQASGDVASIPVKGNGQLSLLAASINNLKHGLQKSLEKQAVNDRLKTELITNVSHDLKTPLTSIINYVDLLKKEGLTPEQTAQYVEVLDRKAQRLKALIDDLFEASKMASGAVELQLERVDLVSLWNQAMAEFSDRIEQAKLAFRVNVQQPHLYARLDGRKTWRVFENLISNAVKYALPGTRVFVNLTETEDGAVMTMQNMSAYELNFDADELFERFKRGDQSRHTEGSGLGLAIAKSIVELQGGRLTIAIDGDQFKVTIVFARAAAE